MAKDRIALQNDEFDALTKLGKQWERLQLTPVVDDDYPAVRHDYEGALRAFCQAVTNNRGPDSVVIPVEGTAVAIKPWQSIPHISAVSHTRALRWHPAGIESWSFSDWFTSLAGEVGELGNVIKKMNRCRDGMQQRRVERTAIDAGYKSVAMYLRDQMQMEIGDVYLYLDLLARAASLDLDQCVRMTFNRVSIAEGFPERL